MKRIALAVLLLLTAAPLARGGEREDYDFIRQAFKDQLYLLVQERSSRFLEERAYDQKGENAQKVRLLVIRGALERGDARGALAEAVRFEELHPGSALLPAVLAFKARALYEGFVREGKDLPAGNRRPSEIASEALAGLAAKESQDSMREYVSTAMYIKGLDCFAEGSEKSLTEAADILGQVAVKFPQFALLEEAQYFQAQSYYALDAYETALRIFTELAGRNRKSKRLADFCFWKGQCLFELGRMGDALRLFQEALSLGPAPDTLANIHYNLGWLHSYEGRIEESKASFRRLFDPDLESASRRYHASARYKLATVLFQEKRYPDALAEVLPVLEDRVLAAKAALLAARIHAQLGRPEDALRQLQAVADVQDGLLFQEGQKMRAQILADMGRGDEALGVLEQLLQRPMSVEAKMDILLQKADVHMARQDHYAAQLILRDLLAEETQAMVPGLHYKLARCAMNTNPLIVCLAERERLGSDAALQLARLVQRVQNAFIELWKVSVMQNKDLPQETLIALLAEAVGSTAEKATKEAEAAKKSKNPNRVIRAAELPPITYDYLQDLFVEEFRKGKLPSYREAIARWGKLSAVYPAMQDQEVNLHLDMVLARKSDSPFLPLAYYEKAQIEIGRRQFDQGVLLLKKALDCVTADEDRARYLFLIAHTWFRMAQEDKADAAVRRSCASRALEHLALLEPIQPEAMRERTVSLRFRCHELLRENDKAEETLLSALRADLPADAHERLEAQLVEFYQATGQNLKAAGQKLRQAARLQSADPVQAQRQLYEVADIYVAQQDQDWIRKGEDILLGLRVQVPVSEWTFRAALRAINIQHSRGRSDLAAEAATTFAEPAQLSPELAMEKEMALAFHDQASGRPDAAAARFRKVMDEAAPGLSMDDSGNAKDAVPGAKLKALAGLKLAALLKVSDPAAAADVLYRFYHLFPSHPLREEALADCCRLRIQAVALARDGAEKARRRDELRTLIARVPEEAARRSLLQALDEAAR